MAVYLGAFATRCSLMMKILHVISGLKVGGAEMMLLRLINNARGGEFKHQVVSLSFAGEMRERFEEAGIELIVFDFKKSPIISFFQLHSLIRRVKPDIVQTWLYHSDLIGGLAARLAGSCGIVWNLRSTTIPQGPLSSAFWIVRLCGFFSHIIPDRIICCANSAKDAHIKLRYSHRKITVIPNGYDFSVFERHLDSRVVARRELGFEDGVMVIGVVGRFDPLKDFHNFVTAASYIDNKYENFKFLMVGRGNEWSNTTLRGWIERSGLIKSFYLAGQHTDVSYLLSAMDIFCLPSVNEAFPNVLVEAMAMGLPCVVTRSGDAADILGVNDFVVPVKNAKLLSEALIRMCNLKLKERRRLGESGARKVRADYQIDNIKLKYEQVYAEIASK
jgi:glycosyltransferase involved in cell wall biosynthesis